MVKAKTMRLIEYLLIAFLCSTKCLAQSPLESRRFFNESLNHTSIEKEELLPKFSNYDFSPLWLRDDNMILGFIGENYQRMKIKYLSIIRNTENANKYYVYGKTMVNSNVCQFIGEIEITNIRKVNDVEQHLLLEEAKKQHDEDAIKVFSTQKYILLGEYKYFEDSNGSGTGIFKGVVRSSFIMNSKKVVYDDWEFESDSFSNNQHVGTWTSYKNSMAKQCNWGDCRIPYSGDLDVGAAEFSPNEKYLKFGWDSFYKAFINNDLNAVKKENHVWW